MKGKQLSIKDLKVLPWGTKITWVEHGEGLLFAGINKQYWYYEYNSNSLSIRGEEINKPIYLWIEEPEKMGLYACKDSKQYAESYAVRYGKKSELEKEWKKVIKIDLKEIIERNR